MSQANSSLENQSNLEQCDLQIHQDMAEAESER